ncbi:hypothetical protein FIBSPDRAFT_878250 [Athelia psychrophila]|uniref:Uncharacterized protein n=1 Tax=Athelia psychrophila TaxID=1759441 RepID=A0A167V630_9AGAM|nr:hypothetical protein FIBSPDRAFT_878250 [Fibularhizoctonia sp. CBS 109695]
MLIVCGAKDADAGMFVPRRVCQAAGRALLRWCGECKDTRVSAIAMAQRCVPSASATSSLRSGCNAATPGANLALQTTSSHPLTTRRFR